jgi:phage regulator Rha-like protein
MEIRRFTLDDYEDVVGMHYDFIKEVFSDRVISPKYFFYKEVGSWINDSKNIIVAYKGKTIVGYTLAYVDQFNGLTSPVYNAEIAYIKPEYRNSKAAYLLFKNTSDYAKEQNMTLITNGRIENGTASIMKKHFNLKEKLISFEGVENE